MELFRAWNPDTWLWSDPSAMLLAEVATITSDMRYLQAAQFDWKDGEIPEQYWSARYGPPRPEPLAVDDGQSKNVDTARQVAASMRG